MRALCYVLLLTACASPRGGEYRQSAAPMAPAFNPSWDSPHTVGQPGYIGAPKSVPRSPHTRYLPPTREPGLWAGDGVRASVGPWVEILSERMPLPRAEDAGHPIVQICARQPSDAFFRRPDLAKQALALPPDKRFCLAASLLVGCLRHFRPEDGVQPIASYVKKMTEARCSGHGQDVNELAAWIIVEAIKPTDEGPSNVH